MDTQGMGVPQEILDIADKIREKIIIDEDGSVKMNGTLYQELLPETLPIQSLIMVAHFNQNIIGGYMCAFGDILMEKLLKDPVQYKTSITVPLPGQSSITISVEKEKDNPNPDTEVLLKITGFLSTDPTEIKTSVLKLNDLQSQIFQE